MAACIQIGNPWDLYNGVLYCVSFNSTVIYFMCITIIITLSILILYMKGGAIPGTGSANTIPGSSYIPPTYYGETSSINKMPGRINLDSKWLGYHPGVSGSKVGQVEPLEPRVKASGPRSTLPPTNKYLL